MAFFFITLQHCTVHLFFCGHIVKALEGGKLQVQRKTGPRGYLQRRQVGLSKGGDTRLRALVVHHYGNVDKKACWAAFSERMSLFLR